MSDETEYLEYFASQPGMDKLFKLFRKEFNHQRGLKGFVRLQSFSDEELEVIADFFDMTAHSLKKKGRVNLEAFDRKLDASPFNGLSLAALLEEYFNEPLITLSTAEERKQFIRKLEDDYPLLNDWLSYIKRNTSDTDWIHQLIEDSPHTFENEILYLSEAIRLLPTRPIRLSVFSQIITLDADSFQTTSMLGKLFLHVLAETKRVHAIEPIRLPKTKAEEDVLFNAFHLYREDITDAVTVVNLFAETQRGYHPMWESAVHAHSVMTVPLREVIKLTAVYPAHNRPIVWVVDNPELFTRLLDELPMIPMICTQEKWTCASWEVFDRLVEQGIELRFVGDLIPESIVRAEDITNHYPGKAMAWRMDVETYLKARDPEITLSEKELALLYENHIDYFACLKDEMKDRKNPAMLMTLIDELISELKYIYKKK